MDRLHNTFFHGQTPFVRNFHNLLLVKGVTSDLKRDILLSSLPPRYNTVSVSQKLWVKEYKPPLHILPEQVLLHLL